MISLIRDLIESTNNSIATGVSRSNHVQASKDFLDDQFSTPLVLDEDSVEKILVSKVCDEDAQTADGSDCRSSIDMKMQRESNMNQTMTVVRLLVSAILFSPVIFALD